MPDHAPIGQVGLPLAETAPAIAMTAITLWQPWASLIAAGLKRHETRHWYTFQRGPLAIHAAVRPCVTDLAPRLTDLLTRRFGPDWPALLPRGAVLCTAVLGACIPTAGATVGETERLCGNWSPGRHAWRLDQVAPLDTPVPAKGKQGFWTWRRGATIPSPLAGEG